MTNGEINMTGMMKECMKSCRWCALFPVIFGGILFSLGYYLDVEVVRILWLIFAGFIILIGLFMLMMANVFFR